MMSFFSLFVIMVFSSQARAAEPRVSPCGVYELKGELVAPKDSPGKVVFVVNEGTRAETRFDFQDHRDFDKIASHLNQPVEMKAVLSSPISGMRGRLSDLSDIRLRVPDPLRDMGLRQLRAMKCRK